MSIREVISTALGPALVACLFLAAGCNVSKNAWQAGIPGWKTSLHVTSVTPRDGYLDVLLERQGMQLRSFAPNSEVCRRVLQHDQPVTFVESGPSGGFRKGDQDCRAAGIGSLAAWRSRRGRATTSASPVPRAQASYRTVYSDSDVVLLRGRFPLANRIGFTSFDDAIAVVPNTEICQAPIESGVASMEFRDRGRQVLSLVSTNGLCPIVGLIRPTPAPAETAADG